MRGEHHLHTRVLTTTEDLCSLEEHWRKLHNRAGETVFQTYDWIGTWWETVGAEFHLRVLTLWDNSTLVGILPCFIQPLHLGFRKVNRLRMAGEYGVYGEYAPLVDPDFIDPFVTTAGEFLADEITSGRVDFLDWSTFRATSRVMTKIVVDLEQRGLFVQFDAKYSPRVSLSLPSRWEDYLAMFRSHQRSEIKRDLKILGRDGVAFEIIRDPEVALDMLDDLIKLHTMLWKRRGAGGHFVTDRHFERFLRHVTSELLHRESATVYSLTQHARPIAIVLNFHVHKCYSAYIVGRDLDHELSSSSPGRALFGLCIENAINRGFTEFDFLAGDQPYKLGLGGSLSYYGRIIARNPGRRGFPAWLAYTLLEARFLVHIKFYRHKLLPKLNKTFRRPT